MRRKTKRLTWGRGSVVQCLRSAVNAMDTAINVVEQGDVPGTREIKEAIDSLNRAIMFFDIYKIDRKRLRHKIEKIQEQAMSLISEFQDLPITPEEKAISKHQKVAKNSPVKLNAPPSKTPPVSIHTKKLNSRPKSKK